MVSITKAQGGENEIVLVMKDGDEVICKGAAEIRNGVGYIVEICSGLNGFSMGKALLNALDLNGITDVCWECDDTALANKLKFSQVNGKLQLNLNGYFVKPCEN